MRIQQNLLRRNLHSNGLNHQNNNNGLYNNNNSSSNTTTSTNNKRNQGKEVEQDVPVRKSTLKETENEEKTSFLNPELQRELNRILAEADADAKLNHDSEDSSPSASSSSSISSASSEEEDEYEHPRRLFLEEIAEEDEEEEEEDDEDDDEEVLEDEDDDDLDANDQQNPTIVDDDKGELEEACSDFASDSDATITNEQCIEEEIEADHDEIKRNIVKSFSSPVSVSEAKAKLFSKQQQRVEGSGKTSKFSEKQVEGEIVLHKTEDDDSESAVENEWGIEQIDATPNETSAEHARGETGISTEADYQEPVESEQQQQYQYQQQPHRFNHLHGEKYSEQSSQQYKHSAAATAEPQSKQETYKSYAGTDVDVDGESVSEVSQQPLNFVHQQKKQQHEHPKEPSDQLVYEESRKSVGTSTTYCAATDDCSAIPSTDEEDEESEEDDDDDDDDENSFTGSSTSSSGSSIATFQELEQEQSQHEHVEIRLFHDARARSSSEGSNTGAEENTSKYISREWDRESKCRAELVDLQTSKSSEVHDFVPESPGESGTGSSSSTFSFPLPPTTSPSQPFKSSLQSSASINSSYLSLQERRKCEDVSVCDSCTNSNISPRPIAAAAATALHTIIKNNKIPNTSLEGASAKVTSSSTISSVSNPIISPTTSKFPSILITSPKPSPTTEVEGVLSSSLSSATANTPKKKRVSFQEQVESKTYSVGDEPSSVALSASNFNKNEKEYSDDEKDKAVADGEGASAKVANERPQELNSSFSASLSYSDSKDFYNNCQFSTADFWASRNGAGGKKEQHNFHQPVYYSESENSSSSAATEEAFSTQQQSFASNHYYYPTEYFTYAAAVSEPVGSNNYSVQNREETGLSPSAGFPRVNWRKEIGHYQEQKQETVDTKTTAEGTPVPTTSLQASPTRPTSVLDNNRNAEMHQRLSGGEQRLRSVLRKPGVGGLKKTRGERSVTFNESLNLFYEAECSCWIHEDDYHRLRQEEQQQQQQHQHQHHQHHQQFIYEQTHPHYPHTHSHHQNFIYEPPPIEFEDPPTLSPPEGYKDRFFPQEDPSDPDVTRVGPPSPPSARRKVFLKENSTDQLPPPPPPQQKGVILNGLEDEEEEEESKKNSSGTGNTNSGSSKGSRLGGILKGGRLWRSNSAEGKKVTSPPEEPDVVKCTERENRERLAEKDSADRSNAVSSGPSSPQSQVQNQESQSYQGMPTKVSTGTAPLRTSEQIRLAVDSTLRLRTKKTKPECSSLVEKLRWLTSLDDDDPSDSSSQSGFATWPSRDKNGSVSSTSSSKKSDAGTSTNEEFVNSAGIRQPPPIYSSSEAKIKQISYTLEDIDEGLKGSEIELESFITEDGGRIERLKKRYSGEEPGDDYGFSRRPSVKGIKPKFSSTNQIFAQYTAMRASGTETPVPVESQYENTRGLPPPASFDQLPNHLDGARIQLNYDVQSATGRPPEESRAHFEMIRQSFEHASFSNFNRPHSWSVSTLPHPHHTHAHSNSISLGSNASPVPPTSGGMPANLLSNNFGSTLSVSQQQPQNNLSMNPSPISMNSAAGTVRGAENVQMIGGNPATIYGTLPSQSHMAAQQNQVGPGGQPIYGTVRRVPNVIGRPLFLHYGALSVEAHPNKIVQPFPRPTKAPETPSPTQQPPPLRYYGPPIRYYNSPPPVPPRSVTTTVSGGNPVPGSGGPAQAMQNSAITDCQQERGVPEGATDEEPSLKESYSMNV